MGIGKKMTKGMIGGGVNIAHKSKMSQSAKNQMGFSNGMPGPNVVGRGMAQYIAGEAVGVKKIGKKAAYKLGDLSAMEEPPMSSVPAKRTRAERQADRDSKKTTRRAKRADKRVKRNEDQT